MIFLAAYPQFAVLFITRPKFKFKNYRVTTFGMCLRYFTLDGVLPNDDT